MVNIGLLGSVGTNKTSLLRSFVKYLNTMQIDKIEGAKGWRVEKTDFSGEAVLDPETNVKETKSIHPNRVIFNTNDRRNHTLFAPGGDRGRAVVKMGVITISRIAKQIIAVFTCDQPLDDQFSFFSDVRFFPKSIYACLNNYEKIPDYVKDKTKYLDDMKAEIVEFFAKRKISIKEFIITSAELIAGMEQYSDNFPKLICEIIKNDEEEFEYEKQERERDAAEERKRQETELKATEEQRRQENKLKTAEERKRQEAELKAAKERKLQEAKLKAAEERKRQEAELKAAEERKRQEAELKAAEERKRQEAELKAAEERKQREAELKAAEERKQREAELKAAEERKRQEAELKAAEERKRRETELKAAEERKRQEAELKAAEEPKRKEAELKAEGEYSHPRMQIFISYAIKDSVLFCVKELVQCVRSFPRVDQVYYCEANVTHDFIEYMDTYLRVSDLIILLCSENSFNSRYVKAEYRSAFAMDKLIIPVFIHKDFIPTLCQPYLGVAWDLSNFEKNMTELRVVVEKNALDLKLKLSMPKE